MKSLFIILLAGYVVTSDENNYYVIEMQDVPPTHTTLEDHSKKPFNVYWNVPTMQCASKKIYFDNLYENFGIIQNDKDRFKGEKVTILYDPGLFPALFKNESGGKIRFRNGGVPQEGNLSKHLDEFKKELDRSIPDKKFSGIGIIDFESWRPQFRQNFGVLQPYKDVSFEIERKLHWWWKEAWIKDEAKRRFEEAARTYMQSTLSVAKKLRPWARWGFYGFPYCFNMASNNLVESCANGVPGENDEISWLWSESTALYPSVYSSAQLSTSQLAALVRGRLREAARCAARRLHHILPYFWFRYRDAGFLTETDLSTALSTLYKSAATGIIIWGSSNDVNTVKKCTNLKHYVENVLGPAIAKYTKPIMRDSNDNEEKTTLSTDTERPISNLVLNVDIVLDPEFHWMPPENYTQDLKNDVEEQINRKYVQNVTNNDTFTVLRNNSVLIDLVLNALLERIDNATTTTDKPKTKHDKISQLQNEFIISTTEINIKTSTDTSQVKNSAVTSNPLLNETNKKVVSQNIELPSSEIPIFDGTSTTENVVYQTDKTNTFVQTHPETIITVNETTTTAKTNDEKTTENDYDITLDDNDDDDFYNTDAIILFFNKETTDTVDDSNGKVTTINSVVTNTDFTKNEKKVQTYTHGLLDNKYIETSTDKLTTDIRDIFEIISTEPTTGNNNISKEVTDGNEYNTESSTFTIETFTIKKYVPVNTEVTPSFADDNELNMVAESSTNYNDENDTRKSNTYESDSSILTTPTNLEVSGILDLPNEVRKVEFDTEVTDASKTIVSLATEGYTSTIQETSKIGGSEDTEVSTPIVPSTDQVSGASQRKRPYLFCFIFYLYSLSKCLCSIFGQCA